jgi:glycosyltransferase involved in cell wall biosynthesis
MKISVVIPSYNHGKYLGEAIDSVLHQSYPPFEVIVVNDGSVDNTAKVIKPYRSQVNYIYQKNSGIGAARNTGIQHAKGDYLTFLDADDKWPINKLQRQLQALKQDSTLEMIFGHVQQFYCPQISLEAKAKLQCPTALIPGVIASTMLIKTDSFHNVGYFDSRWSTGEFIDWYIKAQTTGLKEITLNDLLLYRRIHDGHLSTRTNRNYQHYLQILRAKLHSRNDKPNE